MERPENHDEKFINPYNFVSLGDKVERKAYAFGELTGKIHCTLTVKTPLAIPDHETRVCDNAQHYTYGFMRINGVPTVTGSEIRGMIRSVYEAATNSCMSVINNNILSAREPFPRKPGVIVFEQGKWQLYDAEVSNAFKAGSISNLWFKSKRYGGDSRTKYFTQKKLIPNIQNIDSAVEGLRENMKIYSNNSSQYSKVAKFPEKDGNRYPVWYEIVDNQKIYLSPACISRTVFTNKIEDLISENRRCADRNNCCPACSLFGMVGSESSSANSSSSKVRFSDAAAAPNNCYRIETLRELAGPKISSTEFYTFRPKPKTVKIWNYDYKTLGYNKTQHDTSLEKAIIRGRKFYLHSKSEYYKTSEITKRNSTMELAEEGSQFSFDVYFDRIDRSELDRLVWCLTLGENSRDSVHLHKLGHGKPIGLGSVKIIADSIEIRKFDGNSYTLTPISPEICIAEADFDKESKYFMELLTITDFNITKGKRVEYPIASEEKNGKISYNSYLWFSKNKELGDGYRSPFEMSVKFTLPQILQKDRLELPALNDDYQKYIGTKTEEDEADKADEPIYKSETKQAKTPIQLKYEEALLRDKQKENKKTADAQLPVNKKSKKKKK